ncbi:ferrous iron transport protein B [Prevotella sp. P5-126]|uniref:ferrous iron transport protein B n=1 Tax=Prevotella sp. P5-126 TaxID=2024216 RepID=UPI000B97733B|nr:ferrous iron transport protein B [Prevotella sp. P5-126]OYP41191.1 ferrous iron transport protein B [Prevotella sp. P5-126]
MKLSDLKTGQHATIVTVQGHGSFRKRIVEMGFVRGKDVEVLLNAPLQDPVKYKVMGYEISLRRQEAEMIVVDTDPSHQQPVVNHGTMTDTVQDTCDQSLPAHVGNTINVALIGNPNCGKTSLFNFASGAHGHVGNYSGVTVDASEARATCDGFVFNLTDLPGTYSLSCYSPEELYVREHLMKRHPDVVINVIDSSNLERNLYLTTQLVDMNVRMVCALNMYDEFERRGDTLDTQTLSTLFGVPFVCTSFKSGRGVQELFREVISVFEDCNASVRHIHINHGHEIESGIAHIQQYLKRNEVVRTLFSTRYMAIKLLEHDDRAEAYVAKMENAKEIMAARDAAELRVKGEKKTDSETAIMDAKYGFIHGALTEAGFRQGTKEDTYRMTHFIDDVLSNKYLGFPIFFLILYVMFQTTFSLGQYPMDWIESAVSWLGEQASALMPEGPLRSMLVDGVIGGVGAVIVFLPQILILYFFISLMEDSGYMARAAFIMDKLMHKMGLHGKSFIPLIMGFGCNVPAIMATRTIESRRSRLITMLILPFMSCSARLPIYIMIIGTFFAAQYRSWVMIMLYVIGVIVAIIVSKVFSSFVVKGEDTPFVMELPPYRWPTPKAIGRHTWEKGKEYLKKMSGIILVASIVVWALGYFPHDESLSPVQQKEQSYIGSIGKAVEPVFELQGFNWKLDVSLIAGVGAKEIVASTIGVIYSGDDSFGDDDSFSDDTAKYSRLRNQMLADGITPLAAFSYLLFVLLYFPCIATVIAIRNETGSWSWAAFSAFYTTAIAWIVSMLVYQIGSLF